MRKFPSNLAFAMFAAGMAAPALATFHLMKVVEVFAGTAASPNAQYVVLQMYASGQNLVGGHPVTVFNAAGNLVGTFTFVSNVANGSSQDKILIATTQAATFFGLSPDLVMSPAMIRAGGKVCFDSIDCVAWGAWAGDTGDVGTPYLAATGLRSGHAAKRRLNISGSATVLDFGDDTDNCATDFIDATPAPRNNARVNGTIPAATCGNGVIEGLEECDDNNLSDGDACTSTCLIAPQPPVLSIADASTSEGNAGSTQLAFTVTLVPTSASPVSVDVATGIGTATEGVDFVANTTPGLVIPAGQASAQFSVTISGDTTVEDGETIPVTLSNASGAGIARAQALGRILNDDQAALSIDDLSLAEGAAGTTSTARFVVRLSSPMPTPVSFDIGTANGSATAGSDYTARAQSGRILDAGRTTAPFEVAVLGDAVGEGDETFSVNLSNVSGATVADASAMGTITNDDALVTPGISLQATSTADSGTPRIGLLDPRTMLAADALPARGSRAEALRIAAMAKVVCVQLQAPDVVLVSGMRGREELALLTAAINGGDANLLSPGSCPSGLRYQAIAAPAAAGSTAARAVLLRTSVGGAPGARLSVRAFPSGGREVELRIEHSGARTDSRVVAFPP